jgi:hypothetical protein
MRSGFVHIRNMPPSGFDRTVISQSVIFLLGAFRLFLRARTSLPSRERRKAMCTHLMGYMAFSG